MTALMHRHLAPLAAGPGHEHIVHPGAAVAVALLSAGCYAVSAVLQERQASRTRGAGAATLARSLIAQPLWWLAVAATLAGAALHVVALALGPLTVVQPVAVTTLVLALPLGAALAGRGVRRGEWGAAAAVVAGLVPVLAAASHPARPPVLPAAALAAAAVGVAALVVGLLALATCLPRAVAPVARAAAAATSFGAASAMTRTALTGAGSFPFAAVVAVACAVGGFTAAQLAYRDGGLGGPLATLTLVEPLVASLLGVALLGERLDVGPVHAGLRLAGLVSTALGVLALTRVQDEPQPWSRRRTDGDHNLLRWCLSARLPGRTPHGGRFAQPHAGPRTGAVESSDPRQLSPTTRPGVAVSGHR